MKGHYWFRAVLNTITLVISITVACALGIGAVLGAGYLVTLLMEAAGNVLSNFIDVDIIGSIIVVYVVPAIIICLFAAPFIYSVVTYCRKEHDRLKRMDEEK